MARGSSKGRAGDDQVSRIVRNGQIIKKAMTHPRALPVVSLGELCAQYLAQPRRRLDGEHLPAAIEQVHRQPAGPRTDLDNPVHRARQPVNDPAMELLGADQAFVELRLKPVQQLPGQRHVGLRVAVSVRNEAPRLLVGQDREIGSRIAHFQLPTQLAWLVHQPCHAFPARLGYRSPD